MLWMKIVNWRYLHLITKKERVLSGIPHLILWHRQSKRLYPDTKLAIGPSIENGFYYDVDRETPFAAEDLEKIEKEMKKIVKEALPIERFTKTREDAIAYFKEKDEPYKVELIEDLPEGEEISFYQQGEFVDLCAGPHLMTTKPVKRHSSLQACRCLLERQREEQDAHKNLRYLLS